jgi:hypothetical protein
MISLLDWRAGNCAARAYCLSPPLHGQIRRLNRRLLVADNGQATGSEPIPYVFEFENI